MPSEPIAIIGLGCRLPGAPDPDTFWNLLRGGGNAIRELPPDRWDVDAFHDPEPGTPGKMRSRWGGFLDDVDRFDPHFFKISPREAARIDPQQRLLLEVAWEAMEHAGQAPERVAGSTTGVFVGISSCDFSRLPIDGFERLDAYNGTGNANSIAANRISYLLDLRGPSLSVDTACSSSLVAVHLACRSLRLGECEMALAGGVNVILTPHLSLAFSQARMLSPDDRCKTFDAAADGYVRAEGCGVIVLKRLGDALRDRDNVLAVIRGTAVNQDGRTTGITAPSGEAQQAVIEAALKDAGLPAAAVNYLEAHGTGTPLGDSIEANALAGVLGRGREADNPCVLGSVKTNIGHPEAAAGIAGVIKTVLALQHGLIPPHLHLRELNPKIRLADAHLQIPTEPRPWPRGERTRVAGVNSFGFGGTNAHVVLAEAPSLALSAPPPTNLQFSIHNLQFAIPDSPPLQVFALSAATEPALRALAGAMAADLESRDLPLAGVCFTANTGRARFAHRLAAVAGSTEQLRQQLAAFAAGEPAEGLHVGRPPGGPRPKVAWMFTGQGAQYRGMGRELYETEPVFRAALDKCEALLRPHLPESLTAYLYGDAGSLDETGLTQPALFAVEYALAQLWLSWGVRPDALIGHSLGEYVAACVAGMLSLPDAVRLVAERGRLLGSLPAGGGMAAVRASESVVAPFLQSFAEALDVAAYNGPEQLVLSGSETALEQVLAQLAPQGIAAQRLPVSHAFHSPLVDAALPSFARLLEGVTFDPPRIPVVSNLTGQFLPAEGVSAAYWLSHLRQPVRFAEGITTLLESGHTLLVEIGPAPTLSGMARRCLREGQEATCLPSLVRPREGEPTDRETLLAALARLAAEGVPVDWERFHAGEPVRRVPLPTHPFERQRCWGEGLTQTSRADGNGGGSAPIGRLHPLLDRAADAATGSYEKRFRIDADPVVREHRVRDRALLPGVAFLEMALAAARYRLGEPCLELRDVLITTPLTLDERGECLARTLVEAGDGPGRWRFRVTSGDGQISPSTDSVGPTFHGRPVLDTVPTSVERNRQGVEPLPYRGEPVILEVTRPGTFDELNLRPAARRAPGPGEVEIQVRAAGLNFMDVLKTLALYPGVPEGPLALGGECSGTVVAVGEGVTDLTPGDDVLALAQPAFARFLTLPACHVLRKPASLTFEEAATIPVAFSTAYYALHHLGRIQPGESILIHSAAGGVGLAALQLARHAGAEIYATAGSEEKREYLRSLGVRHVLDSRTLDFAEEIRRLTGGRGVDLVLNFLAGEAMGKSVETLAPHGRFLEIGRTVIYQNQALELYPFRQNLAYFAIDMNLVCRDRAPLLRELLQELVALFADGSLWPLPHSTYPIQDAGEAFRHMARRKHVGKLVLSLDAAPAAPRAAGTQHAGGTLGIALPEPPAAAVDVQAILDRCPRRLAAADLYDRFRQVGIDYGAYFQAVDWVQANDREVVARVHLPGAAREDRGYVLHPALLDGALQALAGLFFHQAATPDHVYVPFAIDRVRLLRDLPQAVYSHGVRVDRTTTTQADRDVVRADVKVLDEQGRLVLALDGVCLKQVPRVATTKPLAVESPAVGREVPCPPGMGHGIPQLLTHPGSGVNLMEAVPILPTRRAGDLPPHGTVADGEEAGLPGAQAFQPAYAPAVGAAAPPALTPLEPPDWFYEVRWRPAPALTGAPRPAATWLVLMDRLGVGEALVRRLEASGDRCLPVHAGPVFADREEFGFTLPLADTAAHQALVDHLLARGITPTGVIHLATLSAAAEPAASPKALQQSLEEGVYPLLYLTQALTARCKTGLDFRLVTAGGQAVPGVDTPLLPEKAPLWGLGRVIAREYPRIECSGLDLETADRTPGELAAAIAAELAHAPAASEAVRWIAARVGQRLAGELVPVDPAALPREPLPLREDGVYLITGGQGGIGLALAECLATRVRCRLVLLNRTPLDPQRHPERAAAIRALEARGAEVLPAAGDVADPEAMRALLSEIDRRWGRLDGILHAAGLLRDGLIMNTDGPRLAEVLQPKVFGAQVLDALTQDRTLDFFVLCSSVSALLAPPGQGNYVAANAYLDAFAHWRTRARGQWTASINWGPWADTGLAAAPRYREIMQDLGMGCMPTPAAVAAFDRLLRLRRPQLAFVHLLPDRAETPSENLQFALSNLQFAIPESPAEAPLPLTTHHSPLTFKRAAVLAALQDRMVIQIARALQIPPARISREASLLDLGLDSLMAVEVMGALKAQLDLPLSPTVLFDYPTIASLSEYLVDEYGTELGERLGVAGEPLAVQTA